MSTVDNSKKTEIVTTAAQIIPGTPTTLIPLTIPKKIHTPSYPGDLASTRVSVVQDNEQQRLYGEALHNPNSLTYKSQYRINFICSCLVQCNIHTRKDLLEKFEEVLEKICANPKIFKGDQSTEQHFELFKSALRAYSDTTAIRLSIREEDLPRFGKILKRELSIPSYDLIPSDDLSRVTHSYDRLANAFTKARTTNQALGELIEHQDFITCPHIILGAGDTGTTLWMEKYKAYHEQTQEKLSQGQLPDVLMLGEMFGCWKHDYTLAQPHNILERGSEKYNPSDYVSQAYYRKNPYANARHVYQANVTNLAKTNAPLLMGTKVIGIEKRGNHVEDWKNHECEYRLIVLTPMGEKEIYTHEIDICTGLGPAKNAIEGEVIGSPEFQQLHKFDPVKKFTPIVDGNQFILTDSEEQSEKPRTIVVYGGGGTAAACYRKGFFGTDIRTEGLAFKDENQQNTVLWISARGFETAGKGKLVTTALKSASSRKELFTTELKEIIHDSKTGKLKLVFMPLSKETSSSKPAKPFVVMCDQLVYSIGQDDIDLKSMCREFDDELQLDIDEADMPLGVQTKDNKVRFFGAAAMAIRTKEYTAVTWKWLRKENIGPDVGPGSMPPSRAQIRQYISKMGIPIKSINVNIDDHRLIEQFLKRAGVKKSIIPSIVEDILEARKRSTAGFSHGVLHDLLEFHEINDKVQIVGHGHLTIKHSLDESQRDWDDRRHLTSNRSYLTPMPKNWIDRSIVTKTPIPRVPQHTESALYDRLRGG